MERIDNRVVAGARVQAGQEVRGEAAAPAIAQPEDALGTKIGRACRLVRKLYAAPLRPRRVAIQVRRADYSYHPLVGDVELVELKDRWVADVVASEDDVSWKSLGTVLGATAEGAVDRLAQMIEDEAASALDALQREKPRTPEDNFGQGRSAASRDFIACRTCEVGTGLARRLIK